MSIRKAIPLPVIIAGFKTDRGSSESYGCYGVIIIVPVVLIVWALQRDFVKGLTMGAVKE